MFKTFSVLSIYNLYNFYNSCFALSCSSHLSFHIFLFALETHFNSPNDLMRISIQSFHGLKWYSLQHFKSSNKALASKYSDVKESLRFIASLIEFEMISSTYKRFFSRSVQSNLSIYILYLLI